MNVMSHESLVSLQKEQRRRSRIRVALPALAFVGGTKRIINIVNLALEGAMIESAVVLEGGDKIEVMCGTISVDAVVIWRGPNCQYGLRFQCALTEREVREQIARSSAISALRDRRVSRTALLAPPTGNL